LKQKISRGWADWTFWRWKWRSYKWKISSRMVFTAASSCYDFRRFKSWFSLPSKKSQFSKGRAIIIFKSK